jgi:hypothetical protein
LKGKWTPIGGARGSRCVGMMGVGWGVWSWAIIGVDKVEGEKFQYMYYLEGLGKCLVGVPHSYEGLGVDYKN